MIETLERDRRVCPRCGGDAAEFRFCPICGLDLAAQGDLPRRSEWEQQRAAQPWPPPADGHVSGSAPDESQGGEQPRTEAGSGPKRSPARTSVEIAGPLLVIGALAFVLLRPSGGAPVPGALQYDARAAPLMSSLRASREQSLRESPCQGCADVGPDGGGCSGYQSDWTCDVPVKIHRRDPQIQAAQLPATSNLLETYKVTWEQNGCWEATENCVSGADSAGHICPPPVVAILNGCIQG